ncbi:hypothetical protein ACILDU_00405 [Capnocytophaga canimorsus]|uniref:hypothetical protein n=2 Tax=Capnocytophaga canimorsus TaxID=28188 RepID=UPI0037D85BA1
MLQINDKITEILEGVQNSVPVEEWDNFSLTIMKINLFTQMRAFYEANGEIKSFDPESSGIEIFGEAENLRKMMYELAPEKGAWFSAFFTVQSDGQFHTHFEYDEKPEFSYEPSKEKYIDDLKHFPREEHLIPQWLKDIINS